MFYTPNKTIMNFNINKLLNASDTRFYAEKLVKARGELAGGKYCRDVQALLPTYSDHAIHNIVNGRGVNELVLAALLIVVGKRAKKAASERLRLEKMAERAGLNE